MLRFSKMAPGGEMSLEDSAESVDEEMESADETGVFAPSPAEFVDVEDEPRSEVGQQQWEPIVNDEMDDFFTKSLLCLEWCAPFCQ